MDLDAREAEAARFLDEFPWETGAVLIGGYAVAAYGPPRFSADVDLVLPRGQLVPVEAWLDRGGFRHKMTFGSRESPGGHVKLRVGKGTVSGDLYFGGVRDRESGAEIQYDWLAEGAQERILRLRTSSTTHPVRLVRPEGLWVLKLVAGRSQDLSDLFAIREEPVEGPAVGAQLASLGQEALRISWGRLDGGMRSEKEYRDTLSRWTMGSPDSPRNRGEWARFREKVTAIFSDARKV
jgi:hypothetical protein